MSMVSIIIPIYNVEAYIERCARSLFVQTLEEIEYIFVNDCTLDRSIEILKKVINEYPDRKEQVKIISHSCNKGIASARNTGLDNVTGEYVGWVDPDDWIEENMFELLYNKGVEFDADIVSCDYNIVYSSHKERKTEPFDGERISVMQDILEDKITAHIWNRIVKSNVYSNYSIRFLEGCDLCEDRGLCVKLLSVSSCAVNLPFPLYNYVWNTPNSIVNKVGAVYVKGSVKNMIDAMRFVAIHNMYIELEKMQLLNLIAKRELLKSQSLEDILIWKNTFPESNRYVFVTPGISLKYKVIGFIAAHNMLLLLRIWTKLKFIKSRL